VFSILAMNLPFDLQSKRNQLLIVGSLLSALILHTFVSAGGFQRIEVQPGVFPGGDFAYKFAKRDYAAAPSLLESVANDARLPAREMADRLYVVYYDDPSGLNGHAQRFAAGYLATDKETRKVHKKLMDKGTGPELTDKEKENMPAQDVWARSGYESETLRRFALPPHQRDRLGAAHAEQGDPRPAQVRVRTHQGPKGRVWRRSHRRFHLQRQAGDVHALRAPLQVATVPPRGTARQRDVPQIPQAKGLRIDRLGGGEEIVADLRPGGVAFSINFLSRAKRFCLFLLLSVRACL
jgi:hypothetical protein